jgi:hypothetical protein
MRGQAAQPMHKAMPNEPHLPERSRRWAWEASSLEDCFCNIDGWTTFWQIEIEVCLCVPVIFFDGGCN